MLYNWDFNSRVIEEQPQTGWKEEISRDISVEQQDAIREIVASQLADSVWNDFFYKSEFDPVGSVLTDGDVYRWGETNTQFSLKITRETRLRSIFNVLSSGSGTAYITFAHVRPVDVGYTIASNTGEFVGIKITGDKLYSMSSRKGASKIVELMNISTGDDIILDMRFFPGERVDFFIDTIYMGSITENLPNDNLLEIYEALYCEVTAGGSTQIDIQRVEFLQRNK